MATGPDQRKPKSPLHRVRIGSLYRFPVKGFLYKGPIRVTKRDTIRVLYNVGPVLLRIGFWGFLIISKI